MDAAFTSEERHEFDFPIHVVEGRHEIHVVLHALNSVGLTAAAANATVLFIESDPPSIEEVEFFEPSIQVNASCGDVETGSVYHPADHTLYLAWLSLPGLARMELCLWKLDLVENVTCQALEADATNATTAAIPSGNYNLTLTAVSLGGHTDSLWWAIHSDGSPPTHGLVHVGSTGEDASYWGVQNEVTCSWEGATDLESGVASYTVRHISHFLVTS